MAPRTHVRLAAVALLVSGALVGAVAPAAAFSVRYWAFTGPAVGMPTTDVAARTITAARVSATDGPDGDRVSATVTLGAMPDAASEAELHLMTGMPDGDECRPRWELVVPTTSATIDDSGDAVVQVDYPVDAADWEEWSCVSVSVTAVGAPETVHDRWDGAYDGLEIGDPGGHVRIKGVHVPDAVRPHRWFPVRLELKNVQSDVTGVRVTGDGKGLRVMPTHLGGLETGESITTRLWVRLQVDEARRLRITTIGFAGLDMEDSRTVTIRPR